VKSFNPLATSANGITTLRSTIIPISANIGICLSWSFAVKIGQIREPAPWRYCVCSYLDQQHYRHDE